MDGILVLGGLVAAILAVVAWQRTNRLISESQDVRKRLIELSDRLHSLELAESRRARSAAAPTVEAAPKAGPPIVPTPLATPPIESVAPEPAADEFRPEALDEIPAAAPAAAQEIQPAPAPILQLVTAATPVEPAKPNPITAWLLQGNPLAKLGVVLMFFGLAYLLRFASERGYLPIELRLAGAAAIAMGLLVVGWRLRLRNPVYGLTLQGGSIGALYLTSFAAFRFYSLLPHSVVFALLIIICAASVTLAVLQGAQSLAFLASLGGYLAPILLSTGGGNPVALFSYYTLLSAGIVAIAFWKTWRPLNLIGFAFTFGVGAAWGVDHYEPSMYGSMQILLALNIAIYGIFATLASLRRAGTTSDAIVDGSLVFGTPLAGFGLQVGLTRQWEYGPAFSALGGGFVTLAIPLALSARWTSMAWALEGLGLLWVGRAQDRARMIWSGTGLLALAGGSAWVAWTDGMDTPTFFMIGGTLAIVWLMGAWFWSRDDLRARFKPMSAILLTGGVIVWAGVIIGGSERLMHWGREAAMLGILAMSVTSIVWTMAANRWTWRALGECAFVLWPMSFLAFAGTIVTIGHPFDASWWSLAWIAALAAGAYLLRWGRDHVPIAWLRAAEHATFVWWIFGLALAETAWRFDRLGWGSEEWQAAGLLTVASSVFFGLRQLQLRRHWTVTEYPRAYWIAGALPAVFATTVLLFQTNLLDGRSPGWPYVPLLNPIELAAAFALLMAVVWWRALRAIVGSPGSTLTIPILAALVWWINGLLLRTLSTVGGVSWTFDALWNSAFIQTSMAIAWTVAALVCMAVAARRAHRQAWFVGAGALAAVVVKLFLVDSARGGGLARAIAFIGVAVLVLVIGYMAPLPPRARPEGEALS